MSCPAQELTHSEGQEEAQETPVAGDVTAQIQRCTVGRSHGIETQAPPPGQSQVALPALAILIELEPGG